MTERFRPREIGANWLACFVCGSAKDGFEELDSKTHEPTGKQIPSVMVEDGIHYRGGYYSSQPDMASFVENQEAGKRVVELFETEGSKAFLDSRPSEPNRVQVKIGACKQHLPNLQRLRELTKASGTITREMIQEALGKK